MKLNRSDHPFVRYEHDVDGFVHAVSGFGDTWCEEEGLVRDLPRIVPGGGGHHRMTTTTKGTP